MSHFAVTLTRIKEIKPHPAADRLELARVEGNAYQFCIQKGLYQEGQKVVYFPIESVLPEQVIDKLGLWAKDENGQVLRDSATGRVAKTTLVGKEQNRIASAVLRGEPSQGMLCPAHELLDIDVPLGADLTAMLGVTKYEPPETMIHGARLLPLPDGLGVYDIDNAEYYPDLTEALMDVPVLISEKCEGANYAVGYKPDGTPFVAQRNNEIVEDAACQENTHWKVARKMNLHRFAEHRLFFDSSPMTTAVRAELIGPGIQGNIYGLAETSARIFDIKVGSRYLDAADLLTLVPEAYLVPVLSAGKTLREWLEGRTLAEASNGQSVLNPQRLREGIVIKPMVERTVTVQKPKREDPGNPLSPIVGYIPVQVRAIIKQRSPKYLAKEK